MGHECDARNTHNARKHVHNEQDDAVDRDYHACHGGHYDIGEDGSPSLVKRGPKVFSSRILQATVLSNYCALITVPRYTEETNPDV